MPVIWGFAREDGLVQVESTSHRINEVPKDMPDGYVAAQVPPHPPAKVGIEHVMVYDPTDKALRFIERQRDSQEVEAVIEAAKEQGREEIRALVREAEGKGEITGIARAELEEKGVIPKRA